MKRESWKDFSGEDTGFFQLSSSQRESTTQARHDGCYRIAGFSDAEQNTARERF